MTVMASVSHIMQQITKSHLRSEYVRSTLEMITNLGILIDLVKVEVLLIDSPNE